MQDAVEPSGSGGCRLWALLTRSPITVGYHEEREETAEINERRKRTIEQIVLENQCNINPLYGLIGDVIAKARNTKQKLAGVAGTTFGGLLVTVLYVLMPNNNPFLHPEHWYSIGAV